MAMEQPAGRLKEISVRWLCLQVSWAGPPLVPQMRVNLWIGFEHGGLNLFLLPALTIERDWSAEQRMRVTTLPILGDIIRSEAEGTVEVKVN